MPKTSSPVLILLPTDFEGIEALADLALDVRWSWNHAADQIWKQLAAEMWEFTHSPWAFCKVWPRIESSGYLPIPHIVLGRRFA